MSAPRVILASLSSFCQKLSKLMEIWRSSDQKNKIVHCFLRHGVYKIIHKQEYLFVTSDKPQQSAVLGEVAVPGGVWSDRRCLKIAPRQRDVTLERLQTARRLVFVGAWPARGGATWWPSFVVWAVGQCISGERATLIYIYLSEDTAGDRRALVVWGSVRELDVDWGVVWARGVLWTCDYIVLRCITCVVIDFWVDCHRMRLALCELLYEQWTLSNGAWTCISLPTLFCNFV